MGFIYISIAISCPHFGGSLNSWLANFGRRTGDKWRTGIVREILQNQVVHDVSVY